MELITRIQAKESGLKYFFTGKVCKRGHLSKRKIGCGTCYECHLLLGKPYNYNDTVKNRKTNWSEEQKKRNRANKSKWARENKGSMNAQCAKRRAAKKQAIPRWANLEKIKEIYRNCPKNMQVDHIIPLLGKEVCGLHVENNLQYLTKLENIAKGNRYVHST